MLKIINQNLKRVKTNLKIMNKKTLPLLSYIYIYISFVWSWD